MAKASAMAVRYAVASSRGRYTRWLLLVLGGTLAVFLLGALLAPRQHAAGPFMRALSGNSTELETLHAQVHELQQAVHELQVAVLGNHTIRPVLRPGAQQAGGDPGPPLAQAEGACPPGRERVLVVALAQTRAHALTWQRWESNFLDNLTPDARGCTDLALCVGQEQNTSSNPFYQRAKYVFVYPEVEDWGAAYDDALRQVNSTANWRQVLCVPEQFMGGILDPHCQQPGSAGILIFFRWFLMRNLNSTGAFSQYERFIVTRSDYMHKIKHAPLSLLPPQYIWIPDGEQYNGVTDRHIIVPQQYLSGSIDFMTDMLLDPEGLVARMKAYTHAFNLEAFIKFTLLDRGLWPMVRFFPYTMFTVRGETDKTRWQVGDYNAEEGMVIKYPAEYESYKRWRDILKTNEDWAAHMATRNLAAEGTR